MTEQARAEFRAFYLAGYEEAKKQDKGIVMLGTGSGARTRELLGGNGRDADLMAYVDGLAIGDAVEDAAVGKKLVEMGGGEKKPLWLLPPVMMMGGAGSEPRPSGSDQFSIPTARSLPDGRGSDSQAQLPWGFSPAAAGLAAGAAVVPLPPPAVDRGVTAHLLGGAAFLQRVDPESLPYIAVFQGGGGDGYGVAVVAGLSAHTAVDAMFPALAKGKTIVVPGGRGGEGGGWGVEDQRPPYPNFEVADDNEQLRVVDASGSPVDCRVGDTLYVPVSDQVMYVLASGSAEDLTALLRQGTRNRLPMVEIEWRPDPSAPGSAGGSAEGRGMKLKLTNITTEAMSGKVRVIDPTSKVRGGVLGERAMGQTAAGQSVELEISAEVSGAVVVEVETERGVQRTAVVFGKTR